jgi:hypothetical protein
MGDCKSPSSYFDIANVEQREFLCGRRHSRAGGNPLIGAF